MCSMYNFTEITKSQFIEATKGCSMVAGVFGGRYWFKPGENEYFAYQTSEGFFIKKICTPKFTQ